MNTASLRPHLTWSCFTLILQYAKSVDQTEWWLSCAMLGTQAWLLPRRQQARNTPLKDSQIFLPQSVQSLPSLSTKSSIIFSLEFQISFTYQMLLNKIVWDGKYVISAWARLSRFIVQERERRLSNLITLWKITTLPLISITTQMLFPKFSINISQTNKPFVLIHYKNDF